MKILRGNVGARSPGTDEIESFLNSNFSTIFHEPKFNRIVAKVFGTQFYYLCVYNDYSKLIALCPCHSQKNNLTVLTQSNPTVFEVPYGGWVFDGQEIRISKLMSSMQLAINEGIIYWSVPQINGDDYSEIEKRNRFQTAVVDLDQSEGEIWENSIKSKRRNMIRKAERNKIAIEKIDHARFKEYYEMMVETYDSAHLKIRPMEYYISLLEAYAPENKAVILLAKMGPVPVAGVMLLRNKHLCHYWLGAGRHDVDNLGQGELLQWEAIKWAKEQHSRYYDLCVLEPERLPNIARFKSGFSNRFVPFYNISKRSPGYRFLYRLAGHHA